MEADKRPMALSLPTLRQAQSLPAAAVPLAPSPGYICHCKAPPCSLLLRPALVDPCPSLRVRGHPAAPATSWCRWTGLASRLAASCSIHTQVRPYGSRYTSHGSPYSPHGSPYSPQGTSYTPQDLTSCHYCVDPHTKDHCFSKLTEASLSSIKDGAVFTAGC